MRFLQIIAVIFLLLSMAVAQNAKTTLLIGGDGTQYMQPVYSPDGKKIAFTGSSYKGLWIMNSDGSDIQNISDEFAAGYRVQWSFDSNALLSRVAKFEEHRRFNAVKIFNLKTAKTDQITEFVSLMPGIPVWNALNNEVIFPSGKALETRASGKNSDFPKSGTRLTVFEYMDKIVVSSSDKNVLVYLDPIPGSQYLKPAASRDGSKIAFEVIGGNMFVMNADGSNLVDLGTGFSPSFSGDGAKIIYMISEDDGHQFTASDIYSINIDGSNKQNLTNTPELLEMHPDSSPTESKVVYDVINDGAIYQLEY